MKKARLIVLIIGFSFYFTTSIQCQQVVSAAGNYSENTQGSLSWTLGEVAVKTIQGADLILTQGFHQTKLSVTGVNIIPGYEPDIIAYPNPTDGQLKVKLGDFRQYGNWNYTVYDKSGKKLLEKSIVSDLTSIYLGSLPSATYFLKVYGGDKDSKIFKIVKQ